MCGNACAVLRSVLGGLRYTCCAGDVLSTLILRRSTLATGADSMVLKFALTRWKI